jgi:hypothetical protein
MIDYRSIETLEAGLENIKKSPTDNGMLYMIVVRPTVKEREIQWYSTLTPEYGMEGDHWVRDSWKVLQNGSSDPAVQISIMNSRCLDLVATSKERWPLSGDNLIVDMDLSAANLKPGQRLSIGSVILEVSVVPRTGCNKFRDKFGVEAYKFVSNKIAHELNLRGIFARVVEPGEVAIGDRMKKI